MLNLTKKLEALFLNKNSLPILLILIALLAFGLFLPRLGLYWDDWPVVLMAKQADLPFLQEFYSYDRPLSYWTYQLTLPLLGTSPQVWQVFTILLKVTCAWLIWRVLLMLWPDRKFTVAGAALLFLVYPSFTQQNISIAYSQHFISLGLYFFSVWAMLLSLESKRRAAWITAAVAAQVIHLGTLEYFAGLELLRPVFLYFYAAERGSYSGKTRNEVPRCWGAALFSIRVLREWSPYIIVLFIFVVWRVVFLSLPDDPNSPQLLANLWTNFPTALLGFIERTLQDFIKIVLGPWENTINSDLIDFSNASRVLSIALAITVGLVTTLYLRWSTLISKRDSESKPWGGQAVVLGLAAIFLGMLPVRIADRSLLAGLFSDRFTLPALFGASLFWVGLARSSVSPILHRAVVIGVLVGISVGYHFRTTNTYSWDWTTQERIYWQMYWRMPNLSEGVALVGNGALSGFTNEYAAAAAVNTLYRSSVRSGLAPLWVLDFYDDLDVLDEGMVARNEVVGIRNLRFEVDESRIILFDYSNPGQCLWILDAGDEWNLDIEPEIRNVARLSNVGLINPEPGLLPYPDVFGPQPTLDWCYYFQKIELTGQFADWEKAIALWIVATEKGLKPNNQYEILTVVEALVRTGDLEQASKLSLDAMKRQQNITRAICMLWMEFKESDETTIPPELGC